MVRYAFDSRSSKILLTAAGAAGGDVYIDINNILAMGEEVDKEDANNKYTVVILATGGDNTVVAVKETVQEIVDFIKQLADEQMARREAEAKAREEEFKKAQAAQQAPQIEDKKAE